MQKNSTIDICPSLPRLPNTCTLGLLHTFGKSQDSSSLVTAVIFVTMNLLLLRPKGLLNLLFCTPSLTRSFTLYHAHQKLWKKSDEKRLRARQAYTRNKARFDNAEATQQPPDFYWSNARYSTDPTWRSTRLEYRRAYHASKTKNDEVWQMCRRLSTWVVRLPWLRDELPWQSHRPVAHDEHTERYCVGCEWTRPGGRRVYWQSLVDPDVYLCTKCYVPSENPDWSKIMPKGYEDVRDIKTMKARKEQLDPSKAPPS